MKSLLLSIATIITTLALSSPSFADNTSKKYHAVCFAYDDRMICDNEKIWIVPDGTLITLNPSQTKPGMYQLITDTKASLKKVTAFEAVAITNQQKTIMYTLRKDRVMIYRPGRGEQPRLISIIRRAGNSLQFRAGDM